MTKDHNPSDDPFEEVGKTSSDEWEWSGKRDDPFVVSEGETDDSQSWPAGEETDASHVILDRIAEREDCAITDLPPLEDTISVEAVDELAASNSLERIEFWYCGYKIRITREVIQIQDVTGDDGQGGTRKA
ncbi:HalOD1 output domain-containing protein [Natrarchaeobaculum sulfurireducens]|nr:HalOD1 output domain-containing protein [Natrarchaeobaculum sulfurireducens]